MFLKGQTAGVANRLVFEYADVLLGFGCFEHPEASAVVGTSFDVYEFAMRLAHVCLSLISPTCLQDSIGNRSKLCYSVSSFGTNMANWSITGRGIRKRLRSVFSSQTESPSTKSHSQPLSPRPQATPQKDAKSIASQPERPPVTVAAPPAEQKAKSIELTESVEKATQDANAPIPKAAALSFAERIALGNKAIEELQPSTDGPSFTSGPAAQERAELLASEATIQNNDVGVAYWGPIDNDSSRAKAAGQTLVIDQEECISCGTCVENTEHVFYLPDDSKAVTIEQEGPMDLIQDAIDACPVTCIHWTETPQDYRQLNDRHGKPIS